MNLSNTELKMSMADYNSLLDARKLAETEAATLRQELVAAKLIDSDQRVAEMLAFARNALMIVRFAVGNLPPDMIPGWPYEELRTLCKTIEQLPDYSFQDRDMAIDLLSFVRDCEKHELRRRNVRDLPVAE